MLIQVFMPQVGESIQEASVARWARRPGERVGKDEALCAIGTDKAEMDFPSPATGVVRDLLVAEGEVVRIGTPIARIEEDPAPGARPEAGPTAGAASGPAAPAVDIGPAGGPAGSANAPIVAGRVLSSPVVRRLARENGVDLGVVQGTGRGGRVRRGDVLSWIEARGADAGPVAGGDGFAPTAPPEPTPAGVSFPRDLLARFAPFVEPGDTVEPMSPVRRATADHMALTWSVAPHVHALTEVDLTRVAALRERLRGDLLANEGVRLTYTPFMARALVLALLEHPRLNASVGRNRTLITHRRVHLGLAVAQEGGGLVVPVLRDAQDYTVLGLARRIHDLAERARSRRLAPEELRGGTFTLSNLGVFGNLAGMPLLNQPQVGIVGIGAVQKRVVVLEDAGDAIAVRPMAYVTLGYDHRAVDGGASGAFLKTFRRLVDGFDEAV